MEVDFEFNGIKIEKSDEDECRGSVHTQFHTDEIYELVKKKDNAVIYEKLPWEQAGSRDDWQKEHAQFEYNEENMVINTEIKVEEPIVELKMQQLDQVGLSSVTKATKSKEKETSRKKVAAPSSKRRSTNIKRTVKSQGKTFQCDACAEQFTNELRFISHHQRHTDQLPFACRVCMERFSEAGQRVKHESNCSRRRFECHLCRFTSVHAHLNRFMVHFRKHTGDKPFSCKCCAKPFSSNRMLNYHMKYHPTEIPSKCSFCQRIFKSSAAAKEHESNCAVQRHMECYLCKSTFTYRSSLRRHMPQHTGVTAFNCKYCKKGFVRKEYFDVHMKTAHTNELQFPCNICEQRFARQSDADHHMQFCTKKTTFKCELCNYTTLSKTYAEDHKQKHLGSDEFKCWHCSEVFLQRSKLVHHVKSHNKKSKFVCPHCQRTYHRWLFMERHRKICKFAPGSSSRCSN